MTHPIHSAEFSDTLPPAEADAYFLIAPGQSRVCSRLRELWSYRELLYFLTWRDIKARYKQTAVGAGWAVIQPFLTMVVFSIFLGHLAKMPSDGIPYPIFAYAALVPWTFFANGLSRTTNSLVGNSGLLKKVYFPRLIIPVAAIMPGLIDFALAFVVLLGMLLFYSVWPSFNIFWLPALLLLAFVTALGTGLWLAAIYVRFRDIGYALPFMVQVWMFATPIAYPSSLVPGNWKILYGLNPMVGVVEGFRWALLGSNTVPGAMLGVSCFVSLSLLASGLVFFTRTENVFADLV